jgi:O-antigen/teichoic acid export membrane protein
MSEFLIKKRFLSSLFGNLLRTGISFATGLLLARWLGPEDYGRMAFLLASFMAFKQLLDMASSDAFFTFLSQRTRSQRFINFYWYWIALQFVFSIVLVAILLPNDIISILWKGEERSLIVLAFVAVFMQHVVWLGASRMAEAQRKTVQLQKLNTSVVLVHFSVVLGLLFMGKLALPLLFVAIAFEWSIAGWVAAKMYKEDSTGEELMSLEKKDTVFSIMGEFWLYCMPFIPYAWLSFVHDFADRWMLQHWGGATEQAYYAVARQFSLVALIATSSILNIFWKEIAEAYHEKDMVKIKSLYEKSTKGLYFISAFAVGVFFPWSSEILLLTLGKEYVAGGLTLMLMFLYPVHQTIGQICGSTLLATGHSRLQVVMGLIFMATSLVVAYFMLAPVTAVIPGLGLASQGLAWKMIVLQVIQVNIWLWVIARLFDWHYDWSYQVVGLGLVLIIGFLVKMIVLQIYGLPLLVSIIIATILYSLVVVSILYAIPWMAGISRNEFMKVWNGMIYMVESLRKK